MLAFINSFHLKTYCLMYRNFWVLITARWEIINKLNAKVHFKKPFTWSSFLTKSVVIFVVVILKMTTLFGRNEDRVTGFLKWMDFNHQNIGPRPRHSHILCYIFLIFAYSIGVNLLLRILPNCKSFDVHLHSPSPHSAFLTKKINFWMQYVLYKSC